MRVVESGVSVTAMPSANQDPGETSECRHMSPFCQPLPVMASRSGPCGRQWGGRCGESVLGRLSPTLEIQRAMLTIGQAIAISTTAASRVWMDPSTETHGVLGTRFAGCDGSDPRLREYRVEQRGRFAPLPRTRSPPPRLNLTWRCGEVDSEISPSIVSTGPIPTTLDVRQTLGKVRKARLETLVDLFFSSTCL